MPDPTALAFGRRLREPRLTTILRLARGLGIPPGKLLEGLTAPSDESAHSHEDT